MSATVQTVPFHARPSDEVGAARFAFMAVAVFATGWIGWILSINWWGTIADTSWLITVVERLDAGERLYVDVMENNPPVSVWLYTLPVRLAHVIGVSPEDGVRLFVLLLCFASAAFAGWIAGRGKLLQPFSATMAAVGVFATVAVLSGNAFTERDQIGAAACLPLIALAARRARPLAAVGLSEWLIAGMGASLFCMIKPFYAFVVLALAISVALRQQRWIVFLMPEYLLAAGLTAGYLVTSYLLYPEFFTGFLPLLSETYMAVRQPMLLLLFGMVPWILMALLYLLLRIRIRAPILPDAFAIASLGAWISYFLQGKGWSYHAYPSILFASTALIMCLTTLYEERAGKGQGLRLIAVLGTVLFAHLGFAPNYQPPPALVAAAAQSASLRPTVGSLGAGIDGGFPMTRLVGGTWPDPFNGDWLPFYAIERAEELDSMGRSSEAIRLRTIARDYFVQKKARLMSDPPDILVVDRDGALTKVAFDALGFSDVLSRYKQVAETDGRAIYLLRSATDQPDIQTGP